MKSNIKQIVVNIIDTHENHNVLERFTSVGGVVLNYSGSESRFDVIMSSHLNFSLLNETASDGRYLDLLSGQERRFLVEVKNATFNPGISLPGFEPESNVDSSVIWRGFLLPDVYSEPYKNGSFFVSFTATDSLDILKTRPFVFYKTGTLMSYIIKCLHETGLNQEICFTPGIYNQFYAWDQIQIFDENFTKYNENTDTYDYSNCYEVLETLLKSVGATLFQHAGRWFITGFNRRQKQIDNYVVYDPSGNKIAENMVFLKNTIVPKFSSGLGVSVKSPFRNVQLNVDYKRFSDDVVPESFYKTEDFQESDLSWPALKGMDPWSNWENKFGSDITYDSEDSMNYLRLENESLDQSHFLHPENEVPMEDRKPPFFLNVYNHLQRPTDLSKDYVELKPSRRVFLSPQSEGKPLEFDLDFVLKVNGRVKREFILMPGLKIEGYENGFYRQAFRIDLLLDDQIIFSTRAESGVYQAEDLKMSFVDAQVGPSYLWYTPISLPNWKYSLVRYRAPNALKAEIKKSGLKTSSFGDLNVRVYTPRNGDNSFGYDDFHANSVTVVKLDIKVKTFDNEKHQVTREIRYTTSYNEGLSFSDGKNDLYYNTFKVNERDDYFETVMSEIVYQSANPALEDNLFFYFPIPGIIGEKVVEFYHTLRLYSGNASVYASRMFGKLAPESGIEFKSGIIRISKARIDEFPYLRDVLINIDKITIGQRRLNANDLFKEKAPRNRLISWNRNGSNETLRYLETYGRMIHECQPAMTTVLEGTALDIITPMDLVKFNWMGEKTFIPVNVSIDFSQGKTNVTLSEAKFQNLTDYGSEN